MSERVRWKEMGSCGAAVERGRWRRQRISRGGEGDDEAENARIGEGDDGGEGVHGRGRGSSSRELLLTSRNTRVFCLH